MSVILKMDKNMELASSFGLMAAHTKAKSKRTAFMGRAISYGTNMKITMETGKTISFQELEFKGGRIEGMKGSLSKDFFMVKANFDIL